MPHSRLQHDQFANLTMEIVFLVSHLDFHVNDYIRMGFSPHLGDDGPHSALLT